MAGKQVIMISFLPEKSAPAEGHEIINIFRWIPRGFIFFKFLKYRKFQQYFSLKKLLF